MLLRNTEFTTNVSPCSYICFVCIVFKLTFWLTPPHLTALSLNPDRETEAKKYSLNCYIYFPCIFLGLIELLKSVILIPLASFAFSKLTFWLLLQSAVPFFPFRLRRANTSPLSECTSPIEHLYHNSTLSLRRTQLMLPFVHVFISSAPPLSEPNGHSLSTVPFLCRGWLAGGRWGEASLPYSFIIEVKDGGRAFSITYCAAETDGARTQLYAASTACD